MSEQPWSPFPVQDWSSLPEDPLAEPPDSGPDPPRARRRWWPPLIVFVVIGSLIGALAYLGDAWGLEPPTTAAVAFLPDDGTAAYERIETTRELKTTSELTVTESARLSGVSGVLSTDTAFGIRVFADLYDQAGSLRVWRTTSTVIGAAAPTDQITRVYRANADVTLLGESTPEAASVFQPALVELPADVAPGQSWSSRGSAGDTLDYAAELRSAAGAAGCLEVTGEVRFTTKDRQPYRVTAIGRTWCLGQGMVASTESFADIAVRTTRVSAPEPAAITTASTPIAWSDPGRWQQHRFDTIAIDHTFGEGPMSGSPITMTPAITASGLVVRPLASINDLVATTPKTPAQWTSVWRAHVPGTILTITAFGDVIVVTTSERAVLAYADDGVRLWRLDLDELAPTAPVRLSDDDAVLVDLSGRVRAFAIRTGQPLWVHEIGADVRLPPAVGDGLVVIMDRGGTVSALGAASGAVLWTRELEGKAAILFDGAVVVLQDQTAHALDPGDGATRWLRPYLGIFTKMAVLGDRLVIATKNGTVLLDGDGAVRARFGSFLDLTSTANRIVGWGTERAQVFDATGAVSAEWPLPALTLALQDRPAVPTRQGVLLFGSDWAFDGWNDER